MKYEALSNHLAPYGQEHLLAFWDELHEQQRSDLAAQIEAVDLEQIESLFKGDSAGPDWTAQSRQATPPIAMRRGAATSATQAVVSPEQARQAGTAALAAGKIGVLLVAGGQGSRLGFEHPKGMYPIGPISGATLLELHLKKVVAIAKKHGQPVPVYLMTSPVTHDEQLAFLEENDRFGLAEDDLVVFCQGTMPAVDEKSGKILLADRDRLFQSPDGHGGMLAALAASGAIDDMRRRGIEQLFYLQVDNPIIPIGDPELIGDHLLAESELTSVAVAKREPQDKLGNFVMLGNQMHVIEYSDFPDDVANQKSTDGSLKFWAGSIAVHLFRVAFLERMLQRKEGLPFHIARKKVSHIDAEGNRVEPSEPNAMKFERFIFDLLPQAKNPLVVEMAEEDWLAPVKNAPGAEKDTAEYVQRFLVDQHRRWLEAAGAKVADGITVEIDPLWAIDEETVHQRVKPGMVLNEPTYLCD